MSLKAELRLSCTAAKGALHLTALSYSRHRACRHRAYSPRSLTKPHYVRVAPVQELKVCQAHATAEVVAADLHAEDPPV
jgi:hypothetical protein